MTKDDILAWKKETTGILDDLLESKQEMTQEIVELEERLNTQINDLKLKIESKLKE